MEKKDSQMDPFGEIDHHTSSMDPSAGEIDHHTISSYIEEYCEHYHTSSCYKEFSELSELPVKILKYSMEAKEHDAEKLKALEATSSRLHNIVLDKVPFDICCLLLLWMNTLESDQALENFKQFTSPIMSKLDSFTSDDDKDKYIPLVMDVSGTNLVKIKEFDSKVLATLEAEKVTDVILQEISNHYLNLYTGILSLYFKLVILTFHFGIPQNDHIKQMAERLLNSVDDEVRQYTEELEITRVKTFEIMKKKCNSYGFQWLPDNCKGMILSTGIKTCLLCLSVGSWISGKKKKKKKLGSWMSKTNTIKLLSKL